MYYGDSVLPIVYVKRSRFDLTNNNIIFHDHAKNVMQSDAESKQKTELVIALV